MQHTILLCVAGSAKHPKLSLSFTYKREALCGAGQTLLLYVQLLKLCMAMTSGSGKLGVGRAHLGRCATPAHHLPCADTVLSYMQLPVLCAAYNAARGELYSAGQDPVIRVWEAVGRALLRRQPGHRGCAPDQGTATRAPAWNKRGGMRQRMRD